MKAKYLAIAMAFVMVATLVGCSSRNNAVTNTPQPDNNPIATHNGTTGTNDALEGGGAGGTNDTYNSHNPDTTPDASPYVTGDGALNDIGHAAGDLVEGAGDAVRDVGDAVGNAANNTGRALDR